jgi:hypothetical protein
MTPSTDISVEPRRFLPRYLNTGCLSRWDRWLSFISARLLISLNASKVSRALRTKPDKKRGESELPVTIRIARYAGTNPHVLRMKERLEQEMTEDLFGAYVHGSLGTGEDAPYSDFDALVILNQAATASPRRMAAVARKLFAASRIMFQCDPLQHHGWFVLTEEDLARYPRTYFPLELFQHSRSLLSSQGNVLTVTLDDRPADFITPFSSLARSLLGKLNRERLPRNLHELKALLSQFMLLPALYYQARHGKAVFKRDSFAEVRRDFDPKEWAIMDEVTAIRSAWQTIPVGVRKTLMSSPSAASRYFARRFAPKIPPEFARRLDRPFYARMSALTRRMEEKIDSFALEKTSA